MIRGLYTSALGMMTQMHKMDIITNNIANADTVGYKGDSVVIQSFEDELMYRLDDPKYKLIQHKNDIGGLSMGVFVDSIHTDFTNGSIKETTGSLDLAIEGNGFFVVSATDANGNRVEKYTRDGVLTLNENGELVTKDGYPLLNENGETIVIPNGNIAIDNSGSIYSNGEYVNKLKLVDFENKASLRKYGESLYNKTNESVEKPFTGKVLQGHLESSNVNAVREMIKMVTMSRVYEANQKLIQTHDASLGKAVTEIASKRN